MFLRVHLLRKDKSDNNRACAREQNNTFLCAGIQCPYYVTIRFKFSALGENTNQDRDVMIIIRPDRDGNSSSTGAIDPGPRETND